VEVGIVIPGDEGQGILKNVPAGDRGEFLSLPAPFRDSVLRAGIRRIGSMASFSEASDEDLVKRIRGGDDAALRALSERITARLGSRIEQRLMPGMRRKIAASDILQEAYLSALPRLADFEDRGEGSFGAWFGKIVEAKIADAVRRHVDAGKRSVGREVTRAARCPTGRFAAPGPTPSQVAAGTELKGVVREALQKLPEDSREVIELLQGEGASLEEAATRLGRSREAVKKLYGRALARLEELAGLGEGESRGRRRPTR
jgi:RNA polymerase sigma-70 factor (ECF subfamily)